MGTTNFMDEHRVKRNSHRLSKLLRHTGQEDGLIVDPAGWVKVRDLLRLTRMTRDELELVIRQNNKSRFEVVGDRIRACQGHASKMPVTLEALESCWDVFDGPDSVWHGTRLEAVDSIAQSGILPGERTHVHLAAAPDSRVGKRVGIALLLEVSVAALRAHGFEVYRSSNGVVLTRQVPPACIVGVRCESARAVAAQARLEGLLGMEHRHPPQSE